MRAWRIGLATAGILLGLYGVFRLLTNVGCVELLVLAAWLIGAVVVHDGVLSPLVVSVGWFLSRTVPARARRYLQGFLVVGGLMTMSGVSKSLLVWRRPRACPGCGRPPARGRCGCSS